MAIKVAVIFEGGREEVIREYQTLWEAVADAISLADAHGSHHGDGGGRPKWVEVKRGGELALSLCVIRGGLVPKTSFS